MTRKRGAFVILVPATFAAGLALATEAPDPSATPTAPIAIATTTPTTTSTPAATATATASAAPSATPDRAALEAVRANAQKQLRLGRYEDALASLMSAYEASSEPELLLLIARCHKAMGAWEKAAFYAEEYVSTPQPKERAAGEALLAEAREENQRDREMERLSKLLGPEEGAVAEAAPSSTPNPVPPAAIATPAPVAPAPARKPLAKRGWVWGAAGVLLVGVAAGAATAASSPSETRTRKTMPEGELGTLDRRSQ